MAVHTMKELIEHYEHETKVEYYVDLKGNPVNATIDCITCGAVLVSIDAGEFLGVEELLDYEEKL